MTDKQILDSTKVFSKYRPFFLAQLEELLESLNDIFKANSNIDVNVEGRVKKIESFKNKLEKKRGKYKNSFSDMTDILGVRLITLYKDEDNDVIKVLRDKFQIDLKNSSNKFKMLDFDEMGYLSLHYVCSYKNPKDDLRPELQEILSNLKFEIQVRSALQHAWATVDHRLRYKTLVDVPSKVKRKLFRISALFEVADSEFCHIRDEVQALEKFYDDKFSKRNYNLRLDLSTIKYYLKYNDKKIGEIITGMHVKHYNTFNIAKDEHLEEKLVKYAHRFGFHEVRHIDQLIHLLLSNQASFMEYIDSEMAEKLSYVINSGCTFILNMLLILFEEKAKLQSIYHLSDSSLDLIIKLRKEVKVHKIKSL